MQQTCRKYKNFRHLWPTIMNDSSDVRLVNPHSKSNSSNNHLRQVKVWLPYDWANIKQVSKFKWTLYSQKLSCSEINTIVLVSTRLIYFILKSRHSNRLFEEVSCVITRAWKPKGPNIFVSLLMTIISTCQYPRYIWKNILSNLIAADT